MTDKLFTIRELAERFHENPSTMHYALAAINASPVTVIERKTRKEAFTDKAGADALIHLYRMRQEKAEEDAEHWKLMQKTTTTQYEKLRRESHE